VHPLKVSGSQAHPARSIQFQKQTGIFSCHRPVVYFLSSQCYINRQTQHNRPNILVLYSALLHVSAVHISHHQAGISSHKNKQLAVSPNKQRCKLVTPTNIIPYKRSNYLKECIRNFRYNPMYRIKHKTEVNLM